MSSAEGLIASRFDEWGFVPFVLREVFEDPSPSTVAAALDGFCVRSLGSRIARAEFYEASVGSAHGVVLGDGRRVVVKVHRPGISLAFLAAAQVVQRHLASGGFPCPQPLAGPELLGAGVATAETLLDDGVHGDAHQPAVRRAMARTLSRLVGRCRSLATPSGLTENAMKVAPGELWPTPHDGRFDFVATTSGAEWIDEVARRARRILERGSKGDRVVGHADWRAQNMRFVDGQITAVYDWDSVAIEHEPVLVGSVAHGFTSNWAEPPPGRQFPKLEEAEAFIADYEQARSAAFTPGERRAARAALAYSMAYTARCEHSDALTDFGAHPAVTANQFSVPPDEAKLFLADHAAYLLRLSP
jgi:hypothetical protein